MHMAILDRCVPSEKFYAVIWWMLVFASIVACLSVPQPFVPSLQISCSANSGVGRVQAEKLTPGPLARIPYPHEGKIIFNATKDRPGQTAGSTRPLTACPDLILRWVLRLALRFAIWRDSCMHT